MNARLPDLVRSYLLCALRTDRPLPALVRVTQTGELWRQPAARRMPLQATEDFVVHPVAFAWRARFPIVGPLAMEVAQP